MFDARNPPQSDEQLEEVLTSPNEAIVAAVDQCPGDFMVLGAGGKMGFHISRMLQRALKQLGRSDRLTAVSRFSSDGSRQPFQQCGIEVVAADLTEPQQYESLGTADNVIYLAGIKFGSSSSPDLLQRFNVTMPRLVAEHFRGSRIVALSTGCVYSFTSPQSHGSNEQSETDPPGDYAKSCLLREQAFVDGSHRHGTPGVLVRLNYSIDLRYGVLVDIAQQVLAEEPVDLQTGYVNVIWQGDAAAQILQCMPLADSPPLVLNVTGNETLSVREVAGRFGELFGVVPRFVGQEAESCWLSSNTLSRRLLGDPQMDIECMIQWIGNWLQRGGNTLGKPTHFQNRDGNY